MSRAKHSNKTDRHKQIPLSARPNAFARIKDVEENIEERVEERQARQARESEEEKILPAKLPKANRVIAILVLLSLGITVFQFAAQLYYDWDNLSTMLTGTFDAHGSVAIAYFVIALMNFVGLILVIRFDHNGKIFEARMVIRVLVVLLIAGLLASVALNGVVWLETAYLFQFICAIAYQVYNDPNLNRVPAFRNPFKEGKSARKQVYELDPERRGFIPLNFFNLFWIFMTACVLGLCMEMVFCLMVNHVWADRAGLLWGPFSPIYGLGAVLMTIVLNRYWYRNVLIIFAVAGVIGAGFEFFVSWYMQAAFGVMAWDYSGSFLSLQGRTDFAHACAWGALGVMWIRIILPEVMRIVELIQLKWRATITIAFLVFMLANGIMTIMSLDCWSQREAGLPVESERQVWFAEHYDDQFMQTRFSTMSLSQESALRAQQADERQ